MALTIHSAVTINPLFLKDFMRKYLTLFIYITYLLQVGVFFFNFFLLNRTQQYLVVNVKKLFLFPNGRKGGGGIQEITYCRSKSADITIFTYLTSCVLKTLMRCEVVLHPTLPWSNNSFVLNPWPPSLRARPGQVTFYLSGQPRPASTWLNRRMWRAGTF